MSTDITLTNRSILYLRSLLEQPGWAKTVADIHRGGELLCVVLPEQLDKPKLVPVKTESGFQFKPEDETAFEDWAKQVVHVQLTPALHRVCCSALEHFASQGLLNPGKATFELIKVFGLSPS